jgi:hypothetical protein
MAGIPSIPKINRFLESSLASGGGGLDPDAEGYIDAVVAAGGTVSGGQQNAINTFYKAAKADYYTSFKRLYLPIWGVAAANAIDMITLASGTFTGSVTHAAGYIQGDGTTGYMDLGVSPSTLGLTTSSASLGVLVYQDDSRIDSGTSISLIGSNAGIANAGAVRLVNQAFSNVSVNLCGTSFAFSASKEGVFLGNRTETNAYTINTRRTSGFAEVSSTGAASGVTTVSAVLLARSQGGSIMQHTNSRVGLAFIGTEFALGKPETVTLHLKNLWEGTTGLTLP